MRVHFYATLRATVGQKAIDLPLAEGTCVKDLALEIARRWPALAEQLFDAEGEMSRQVHFMIDGRNEKAVLASVVCLECHGSGFEYSLARNIVGA